MVLETAEVLNQEQRLAQEGSPLQTRLNSLFERGKTRNFLLIAGTFQAAHSANGQETIVPGVSGKTGRMKGKPSDWAYGVPAPDGAPSVAVGRFPARNVKELRAMAQKTLNFEQDSQPAPWRNRLLLLLGNPGGGRMAEWFVEQTLEKGLGSLLRRLASADHVKRFLLALFSS